jgi:hypothetical protein
LQQEIEKEIQWCTTKNVRSICSAKINSKTVTNYTKIIHNLPPIAQVSLHNNTWHVDDLKSLACDRWLSMEIILKIGKMLTNCENNRTLIIDGNHIPQTDRLVNILNTRFGQDLNNVQVILVLNIA